MAQRRMFSKSITNSSNFLMMPHSTQLLYYHLGMNADDDGFCEHFTIMRMVEAKPDDLKILQAKGFVHVFDDKVLVILDWKENNYIRSDRYTPSKYLIEYKKELLKLNEEKIGIPNDDQPVDNLATQVRLGKDRLGKESEKKLFESLNTIFKNGNGSYYKDGTQSKYINQLLSRAENNIDMIVSLIGKLKKIKDLPRISDFWKGMPVTPQTIYTQWDRITEYPIEEKKKFNKEERQKELEEAGI